VGVRWLDGRGEDRKQGGVAKTASHQNRSVALDTASTAVSSVRTIGGYCGSYTAPSPQKPILHHPVLPAILRT